MSPSQKPVGTARDQASWVCTKRDVDRLKVLEENYNVFTHMSPSYGQAGRCITVKGINTINHDGEVIPCPYMDLSIGNVVKEGLAPVLERGMLNSWLGHTAMNVSSGSMRSLSAFITNRSTTI